MIPDSEITMDNKFRLALEVMSNPERLYAEKRKPHVDRIYERILEILKGKGA